MPGEVRLELWPGDIAWFHVNSLHRGFYGKEDGTRRTIAVNGSKRLRLSWS